MRNISFLRAARILAAALVLALTALPARAQDPAAAAKDTVQRFYDALLGTMKQGKSLGFDGRAKTLEPALTKAYDMPTMTKLAVGPAWTGFDEATRQKIIDAFKRYTVATYANRFASYDGERFEVADAKPVAGQRQVVETRLVPANGDPVQLNYLMMPDAAGTPHIVDVFLNGTVSQLATTRSEFTSVFRKDGAQGLITLLDKRVADLAKG
jgi:phospholipid transport system substrate-binding protein